MEKQIGDLVAIDFRNNTRYGVLLTIEDDFGLVKLVTQRHDVMIYVPIERMRATTMEEKFLHKKAQACDTLFIFYCVAIITILGLSVYVSSLYAV